MTSVFDVLAGVGRRLPGSWITVTSPQDAPTTDATIVVGGVDVGASDDAFNRGTLLVLDTTDNNAPKGESRTITDYDKTGNANGEGLLTVTPVLSAIVQAGDRIAIIKNRFKRTMIIDQLNDALRDIPLVKYDTTLSAVDTDNAYTLPAGIDRETLIRLQYLAADTDPIDADWINLTFWDVEFDGTSHILRLDTRLATGTPLRLVYRGFHGEVDADTDSIDQRIHPDLIISMTLRRVLEARYEKYTAPSDQITNAVNKALRWEAVMRSRWLPRLPKRTPKLPYYEPHTSRLRMPIPSDD